MISKNKLSKNNLFHFFARQYLQLVDSGFFYNIETIKETPQEKFIFCLNCHFQNKFTHKKNVHKWYTA